MLTFEEYKAIFDAAPDGYLVVARDGTSEASNPKLLELLGWSAADLLEAGFDAQDLQAASSRKTPKFGADLWFYSPIIENQ